MKILIAVPTFENIAPETFKSIYDLDASGHELTFDFVKGYDCAKARNAIAQKALNGGFDHVLMVDSDIILPGHTLNVLNASDNIVLGAYPRKNCKERYAELFKVGTLDFKELYTYDELTEDRMEVKGGGFGCAFVSANVFKTIKYPWFKYVSYDNGSFLSEDLYFCDSARKHGYKIFADTRIRCGHISRCFHWE